MDHIASSSDTEHWRRGEDKRNQTKIMIDWKTINYAYERMSSQRLKWNEIWENIFRIEHKERDFGGFLL